MDKGRRAHSNEQLGHSSTRVPWSSDTSIEPWHSTPVKKNNGGVPADSSRVSIRNEMDRMPKKLSKSAPPFSADIPCLPILQDSQIPVVDMESATIQRQRRELQLLIAELKDRDRELNTMAASHHKQLQAWEQDRQRVLTLEQRCSRFNDELQKRNEVIRVLTKRVQIVETREKEVQKELSVTQQQLHRLGQKQQHASQKYQDFEEQNQSLNLTVMALSTQVGSLQVREEELSAMLKLKDKDVTEATTNIVDLSARLRDLETSLKESRSRESRLLRDLEENKCRYREARHENTYLKGEGDSWKDELLVLARSKQERTESELHCLRQVCENQQNDLQLLQLNLESAREAIREKNSQGSLGSQDHLKCGCLDNLSPSPIRMRNSGPGNDIATLPMVNQQGTVNSELGVFSAASTDGGSPFATCCLQRLLDESRQMVASLERTGQRPLSSLLNNDSVISLNISQDSGRTDPPHRHTCQSSTYHEVCETPPSTCPQHGNKEPCRQPDIH
ncbi:coiled-coil domain-containing protein 62 isoform 2-T2 [Polymixia lowei]